MGRARKVAGLGLLAGAGMALSRRRRAQASHDPEPADADVSMADMTRQMASQQDPVQEGSGTIAWQDGDGADGASQNESTSGQTPDSRMSQQFHQPAQGTDGGHAGGVNVPDQDRG